MGEETEGAADSVSTLRAKLLALSDGKVDIMSTANDYKNTTEILRELAGVWGKLSDIEKASALELIAGKRQANIVSSILNNWDTVESAIRTSMDSEGSAYKENEKYLESLQGRIDLFNNAVQTAWSNALSAPIAKTFVDTGTAIVNLLDTIPGKVLAIVAAMKAVTRFKGFTFAGLKDSITSQIQEIAVAQSTMKNLLGGQKASTIGMATSNLTPYANLVKSLTPQLQAATLASAGFSKAQTQLMMQMNGVEEAAIREATAHMSGTTAKEASALASVTLSKEQATEVATRLKNEASTLTGAAAAAKAEAAAWLEANAHNAVTEALIKEAMARGELSASAGAAALSGLKGAVMRGSGLMSAIGTFLKANWLSLALTAIPFVIMGISKIINKSAELKKEVEDINNAYKQQQDTVQNNLKTLTTSSNPEIYKSLQDEFNTLAAGVDKNGSNISLTADQYERYREICQTICDINPGLAAGYDSVTQAIGNNKGALENLIEVQQRQQLLNAQEYVDNDNFKKLAKDAINDYNDARTKLSQLEVGFEGKTISQMFGDFYGVEVSSLGKEEGKKFATQILKDIGLTQDEINTALEKAQDSTGKIHFELFFKQNRDLLADNAKLFSTEAQMWAADVKSAEAQLETAANSFRNTLKQVPLSIEEYSDFSTNEKSFLNKWIENSDMFEFDKGTTAKGVLKMKKGIQDIVYGIANDDYTVDIDGDTFNLGELIDTLFEFDPSTMDFASYKTKVESMLQYISQALGPAGLEKMGITSSGDQAVIDLGNMIGFEFEGLDKKKQEVVDKVTNIYNQASEESKAKLEEILGNENASIEEYINGLPAVEAQRLLELDWDAVSDVEGIERLLGSITPEFTLDLTAETTGLENLNAALSESASEAGLTAESIANLKSRYAELGAQGYDLSAMFETTANGIHLNREAVNKLEQAYAKQKLDGINQNLAEMKQTYDDLTVEINNCTDAKQRASLYTEQMNLAQEIRDAGMLAAEYQGLASAYKSWQAVESAGSERDMYEGIIGGFKNIEEEIARGWFDDGTIEFLRLIKGESLDLNATTQELVDTYYSLDDAIKGTTYSIADFFTVDSDGNSTSKGVYNFLNAVDQLEKNYFGGQDIVKKNGKGIPVSFDFNVVGGDEAIAKAMGISEELVQIILRAADDAGFVISLDGQFTQYAELKTKAEEANIALKELGATDYDFDFGVDNLTALNKELKTATDTLAQYKDENGQLKRDDNGNLVKGAQEALDIASYFQATKDQLEEPIYMQYDTTSVEENLQKPLAQMQQFERLSQTINQLKLTGDTEGIQQLRIEMGQIVEDLAKLDEDTKLSLGIDPNWTIEDIQNKLESGEISIPATVDVQVKMGDDITDIKTLLMRQAGLIDDEDLKLIVKYGIDATLVDDYEPEDKEAVVKFLEDHEEVSGYEPEQKNAIVRYVAENGSELLKDLDNGQLQIVADLLVNTDGLEGLNLDKQKVVIDAVINEKRWADWTPEQKEAYVKYIVDGNEPESYVPPEKEQQVTENLDTSATDNNQPEPTTQEVIPEINDEEVETWDPEPQIWPIEYELEKDIEDLGLPEDQKILIQAVAKVTGAKDINELSEKIQGLDDKQIAILANVLGRVDVDLLNQAMGMLEDKEIAAIAIAIGKGNVEGLRTAINGLSDKKVAAIAQALGYSDVASLKEAMNNLTDKEVQAIAEVLGISDTNTLWEAMGRLEDKKVKAVAKVSGTSAVNSLKSALSSLKDKVVNIFVKKHNSEAGDHGLNGTANSNGTAHNSGVARANGDWGLKKSARNVLVGELGQELVVNPNTGKYFTVGDRGAEFIDLPKNAIVFNHIQTKALLDNGYVVGRGKALVNGTALSVGSDGPDLPIGGSNSTSVTVGKNKGNSSKNNNTNKKVEKAAEATEDAAEQVVDFIEFKLTEIEQIISKSTAKIETLVGDGSKRKEKDSLYDKLVQAESNKAETYLAAAEKYNERANAALEKVPEQYHEWAKNGAIEIVDFVGETEQEYAEAIQEYRDWADKADEAEIGYLEAIAQMTAYRIEQLDDIAEEYENLIDIISSKSDVLNSAKDLMEEMGMRVSETWYKQLIANEEAIIKKNQEKLETLINQLAEDVAKGDIKVGDPAYLKKISEFEQLRAEIYDSKTAVEEFNNEIQNIKWDNLDRLIDRFDNLDSELSFLYENFTRFDDIVDDNGVWTDKGIAAIGIAAQQMEIAQTKIQQYSKALKDLYRSRDQYSPDEFIEKEAELKKNIYDSIGAYNDAQDAIVDLNETRIDAVKDGIEKEIDAYKELIDKKKEALDADKDLYDFEKSVNEQQKEIATIRRKLAALNGNTSLSAMSQKRKLQADLAKAEADLEETYYERSLEMTRDALDKNGEEYEKSQNDKIDALDKSLKDTETLVADSLETVKSKADTVLSEIDALGQQYGITISDSIVKPWKDGENAISSYQEKLKGLKDSFAEQLQAIIDEEKKIQEIADKKAQEELSLIEKNDIGKQVVDKSNAIIEGNKKPPQEQSNTNQDQNIKNTPVKGDKVVIDSDAQYYGGNSSNVKIPNWVKGNQYTVQQVGYGGKQVLLKEIYSWVKISDLEGYAKGTIGAKENQLAWVDELGEELQLVPGKNGRLEYIKKGTGIIPADLTEKLMNLALDPTQALENNRPKINISHVTNNEIHIDAGIAEVIHIDTVTNDTLPDLAKTVEKQMDKYMKNINSQIRKYVR